VADKLPREILKRISKVTNKRARLVLDTIARRGAITTEELKRAGYDHPPRAARDVRELGFRLITTRVKGSTGRLIAAYSLDVSAAVEERKSGRVQLPKRERDAIIAAAGGKCQICGATHDLQVDHRVPYEVAGESLGGKPDTYLVLDGSCNRRKSWTCEHCENFAGLRQVNLCQTCYWANPTEHSHVALQPIRRLDVVWQKDEAVAFDAFIRECKREGKDPIAKLKEFIRSGK
jgi:hypothetical protein